MSQPTPLEQIDLLLTAWDERLRRMDENLVALESEAIYQILAGKAGHRPTLEGLTRERVGPALDAVSELFENRERIVAVVTKAKEVRGTVSALAFWETDDKIAEIHRLLRGTSIDLGQQVVALSQRNLLDQGVHELRIDPEQLVAQMAGRFQEARTVLLAVSRAWEVLTPVMEGIEAEMRALRARAAELGGPGPGAPPRELAELAEAEAELGRLRALVAKDPLGAEGGVVREIKPRLMALRARIDAERSARDHVRRALVEAHDLRLHLGEGHERAVRLVAEARGEILGVAAAHLAPPLDEGLLRGLDEWLAKIEGTAAGHRWSSAEVGLSRWRAAAEQYLAADAAAASAAAALLGRRDELTGRLSARRAQAAALAARGLTVDPAVESWAHRAEALLRRHPLPLEDATRAVEHYEAAVVALHAQHRG